MQTPKSKTAAADALVGLWAVALTSFVIATLYFAGDLFIPLALASLLTFLLSPLVARIERWLGRIAAVLLVVAIIFAATGAAGWVLTRQLVDLAQYLKPGQRIFIGVVSPIDPRIETPEEIRDRVLEAARYIPVEQLGTTDDCGFSPFCDDTSTTREKAFAKIRSRVEGTLLAQEIINGK